jgi:DNA-directed RNA polymerase beta subunit
VRDVHPSHYGRLCPIHTPEGPNIGLILRLAQYARINAFGMIETPYVKVEKGVVTKEIQYLNAAEEEKQIIAHGATQVDDNGHIIEEIADARLNGKPVQVASRGGQLYGCVSGAAVFYRDNDDSISRARRCQPLTHGFEHAKAGNAGYCARGSFGSHRHRGARSA